VGVSARIGMPGPHAVDYVSLHEILATDSAVRANSVLSMKFWPRATPMGVNCQGATAQP
jgi:hypothetical protein